MTTFITGKKMKIIKTYEFRAFIVTLTLGLALCYGLKKFEVYGTRLAEKYNQKVK